MLQLAVSTGCFPTLSIADVVAPVKQCAKFRFFKRDLMVLLIYQGWELYIVSRLNADSSLKPLARCRQESQGLMECIGGEMQVCLFLVFEYLKLTC